ncbi:MAG: GNAT family N-acetyltransferase [Leptolyngbyaceae cyanobacterium SL_7_1]|nr:GNAT family N-acetyltransferase [Leptolyngbyaceae cyanobacterium SL_7_1]
MIDPNTIFLETDRLILRTFCLEDAGLLCELDRDPEVMRHISKGRPTSMEVIQERLSNWLGYYEKSGDLGFWAVHLRSTKEFVGWFHLKPSSFFSGEIELGYRLQRQVWGQGYATEGGKALIERSFAQTAIDRIIATTLAYNYASRRVMEKCGLRFERSFFYSETILPGWSEAERRAVLYGVNRSAQLLSLHIPN